MKRSAIKLLCATGVLLTLGCGAYALSTGESLVTLSYLKNTFIPSAVTAGEGAANAKLQESYNSAKTTLDSVQADYFAQATGDESGALYSAALMSRGWNDGAVLELPTGSGLLMLEGGAILTHGGAVIDVTQGSPVSSGTRLVANHRYLVAEGTTARVSIISGAANVGVQGSYRLAEQGEPTTPFYDVCQTDWYYGPVNYVYQENLFSGMDEHHFQPAAAMNRAMLMTVLYRLAGSPTGQLQSATASFADVPDSAWYAPYVKWGASQKITAGTGANAFSPEQQVTRQQVAVLLYSFSANYLGIEGLAQGADLSGYQDLSQVSDWAKEAMAWAVAEGIISSSSANTLTLSPQKSANRAEVATMLRAFAEKIL